MLTLKKSGWLYWWMMNGPLQLWDPPKTLCSLFWLFLLQQGARISLIIVAPVLVIGVAIATKGIILIPFVLASIIVGVIYVLRVVGIKTASSNGVIAATLWGIKHKVCPTVKFK